MILCWNLLVVLWIKFTARVEMKMQIDGISASTPGRSVLLRKLVKVSVRLLISTLWLPNQVSKVLARSTVHAPWTTVGMSAWTLVSILTQVSRSKVVFRVTTLPRRGRIRGTSESFRLRPLPSEVSLALTSRIWELLIFNLKDLSLWERIVERTLFTNFSTPWTFCLASSQTWREQMRRVAVMPPADYFPVAWLCFLVVSPSGEMLPSSNWSESLRPARRPLSAIPYLHS